MSATCRHCGTSEANHQPGGSSRTHQWAPRVEVEPHRINIEDELNCTLVELDREQLDDLLAVIYCWRDEAVTDALRKAESKVAEPVTATEIASLSAWDLGSYLCPHEDGDESCTGGADGREHVGLPDAVQAILKDRAGGLR